MTSTDAPVTRKRSARAAKPQGQWKVDGKEPLNPNEVFKQEDDALNVRQRILDIYSKEGFSSITPEDLDGRFRWMGLYTQRKPNTPGTMTGPNNTASLADEYFMLRVRIDGGAVTVPQLRTLAGISTDFARGTADISDRQNIQYHWIDVRDVPEIWNRLDAVGMESTEACGDCPRVILGSPVAGIAADEIIDPSDHIRAIHDAVVDNPDFSNLPRKFKSAITGHPSLDVVHEINDISLVGVRHPELGAGYDLWVGGGLSTNPHLAVRLGVFVAPDKVVDTYVGVLSIFRDYGYRRMRTRARLKFLVQDWGVEKFRQILEDEYLGEKLPDGPAPEYSGERGDHVGVHEQKDGRFYVGATPVVGRVNGDKLAALADAAEKAGSNRLRFTPHQKVVVLDVPGDKVEQLVADLDALDLAVKPGPFTRAGMSCTGIEYCKLAFVETKELAMRVLRDLDSRFEGTAIEPPISVHLNGCPNSCARIQTADIGLKGQLIEGERPGFQVHLGGGLAGANLSDGELGRAVRGLKVPADELADYIEKLVRLYLDQRTEGETFAQWTRRAAEEDLK